VIADIGNLASLLLNWRETLRGARREKRDRLAVYLQQIGVCLSNALDDLRSGGNAIRACAQLHQYVDLIPPTVEEVLGVEPTERLREGLRAALYVRGLRRPSVDELNQLDEAAGTFTALGDYLRASA
jgi:hypothetical protein